MKLSITIVSFLFVTIIGHKITFEHHKFKMPKYDCMRFFEKYFANGKQEITRTKFREGLTTLY
jgi:hypothetical protein